jgi:hypothetical protein
MHFESVDEEPDKEEKEEKLPEDNSKPFSPPSDVKGQGRLPKDHPNLDTDIDEDEWYGEGGNAAAEEPDNPGDEPHHGRRIG